MNEQTFGAKLATLRKAHNLTQADLAAQLHMTDKAVSKWERDRSLPDLQTLAQLAKILEVSPEALLPEQTASAPVPAIKERIFSLPIFPGVALAMGIALVATTILNGIDSASAHIFAGVGLFALAMEQLHQKSKE